MYERSYVNLKVQPGVKITRQWKSTLYRLNSGNAFRTRVSFRVLLSRDFSRFRRVSLMGNVDIAHK